MAILKRVLGLTIRFGGEEHSGWLPAGAAKPLPTPIEDVLMDVEIDSDPSGCFLCWTSRDGMRCGDTWHQTLAEAEAAGYRYFGIEQDQWASIPEQPVES